MARVPRIDSPCPLSRAQQLRIDGHCGRCNKHVHALDSLDERQRRALFAAARGPLCVSYRVPAYRNPAMAVAMAAMISVGTAAAGQDCDEAAPALQSVQPAAQEPLIHLQDQTNDVPYDTIIVGGISSAEDAQWIDDGSLPDLPMISETEDGQSIAAADAADSNSAQRHRKRR
ncbi:hypothetical protein [Dokdonella immobilis]|uniref:Uncharacterized protein n=1 Tax=Dokdonella immobilis TaxID=578942 RepID=A0A1I4VA83_9GAMM|nr:hypothetical protein [Dokdonella immobilis]SFM98074.1 hypothetical protein SAMN05216289_101260 [Dokdonella immobilis]